MDYKTIEKQILEQTKEFARINNIHYDDLTESMIVNAMRELKDCLNESKPYKYKCNYCGDERESFAELEGFKCLVKMPFRTSGSCGGNYYKAKQ